MVDTRSLPLRGMVIGITAERRAEEQAGLLQKRGATVLHGPTVRTVAIGEAASAASGASLSAPAAAGPADGSGTGLPAHPGDPLRAVTEEVIARPPDAVVVVTGVGLRTWLGAAERWGGRDALVGVLAGARLVARGAKAASAIRLAGLVEAWKAPRETVAEIRAHLLEDGRLPRAARVVVVRHGAPMGDLSEPLRAAGAEVREIEVYRWHLPEDREPAYHLVRESVAGRLAAVTFTSAPGVSNLFTLATQIDLAGPLRDALNGPVVACCIGAVCAEAAEEEGIRYPLQPPRPRLVPMIDALARRLGPTLHG
ncbi:MAG: uroporphyrinogen-III synthase [Acidimicrobiales bacterium]